MSEERVLSALRALAESNRDQQAQPELEAKLVGAFRRSFRMRLWRRAGLGAAAAAAAMIVVVTVNHTGASESQDQKAVAIEAARGPQTDSPPIEAVEAVRGPQIAREGRKTSGRVPRVRGAKAGELPVPEEIATDFFPLMDVAPPFGRGEIVRITVPAAAMRSVGLPVREERLGESVQADVLLGEEGMARAIRFVNFTH